MKRIKKYCPAFFMGILIVFGSFLTSCDDYKSEEFQITGLDLKACNQLQNPDSLGADTVRTIDISTANNAWTYYAVYDTLTGKYNFVPEILAALEDSGVVITNTENQKLRIETVADMDTNFLYLRTNSSSLTFFSDQSFSINIINDEGKVTTVSNNKMHLETAAGCTKLDENEVEVPFILTRYEISVPDNVSLLQLIKNEQTKSRIIYVSIF